MVIFAPFYARPWMSSRPPAGYIYSAEYLRVIDEIFDKQISMSLTTDPNDPAINRGGPQHEKYLVLSEEERRKGFIRPVRVSYNHVGQRPKNPTRKLTPEEQERYKDFGYLEYEAYPTPGPGSVVGRFWTAEDLKSGCNTVTTMALALAETYARDPKFYGLTFCCGCQKHIRVDEFEWAGTNEKVGS